LEKLGASWLTLLAPAGRAIPEYFIDGLIAAGIQPVLHLPLQADCDVDKDALGLLFNSYARWGVRYTVLFDCPNLRAHWQPAVWAQSDLVERFLDGYLPVAELALEEGLIPVFPPLQPGGDYWDLSFLKLALRGIQRRGCSRLMETLALGAYAWTKDRPLDWGAGGPERWPGARPYQTPPGNQDHLGFCIFDWYLAVTEQEVGKPLPILLLRAGSCPEDHPVEADAQIHGVAHALKNLDVARWLAGDGGQSNWQASIPPEVLACNFWLLAADPKSPNISQAWFGEGDYHLPVVDAFQSWVANLGRSPQTPDQAGSDSENDHEEHPANPTNADGEPLRPITHYVLLPLYSWGAADWDLRVIQPLLEHSHPTIGFSLAEACLASRVTVVGGEGAFSDEALDMLRRAGCMVERLSESGMLLAT
jgi:hypothetical protein